MKNGVERIADERQRQIDGEGWTPEHDAEHTDQSLAMAAACYATPRRLYLVETSGHIPGELSVSMKAKDPWPWKVKFPDGSESNAWDKRGQHSRIRQLEIAGALIAAEIDRLQAAE
ncbi:hypothetical protein ACR42D_10565 [Desulfovibrio caledoniensis]